MQPSRQAQQAQQAEEQPGEDLEIHTTDGVSLRATVREPKGKVIGTAVLAHAMFARRSEFDRPRGRGITDLFRERGWRTVSFDFRGHGDSGKAARDGGSWTYDDLVRVDMPAVVACVRARARKKPVLVVGHSLGGHVALAAQGIGALGADAILMGAGNIWMRPFEPSTRLWLAKRAVLEIFERVSAKRGYFPARTLRQGSDDEALEYVRDIARFARTGRWGSRDGAHDYLRSLERVRIPVAQIASDGDRLNCRVPCAREFLACCGGPTHLEHVRASGARAPGHMEIVTTEAARDAWKRAEAWVRGELRLPAP